MKILFVTHDLGYTDSIAIAFLSAIAKQRGHETFYCSLDRAYLFGMLVLIKPDIVAYSVNSYGYKKIIEIHKKASKNIDFISIMGGPHPTICPETFAESGMDAYCIGEGEYAFKEFLERIETNDTFDDVYNLITKNKKNPMRPLINPLDDLPMPDRDLVLSNTFHRNSSKKTFFASRGCPFNCSYCCNNYYHKLYPGKILRRFTVDRVLNEIDDVKKKYQMDFVKFDDDCFTLNADRWLEEFAEKYPERIGVPFNCVLRFDTITDNILELLKKAGCRSLHLSVDSTSHHIRENIFNRKMPFRTNKEIIQQLKKIKKYKIYTFINYMTAAPTSTTKDDLNTIRINKKAHITYPQYTTTTPMEKTELYNYCKSQNLLDDNSGASSFFGKSQLNCFSDHEKNIRNNITLMAPLISKLPFPFDKTATAMLFVLPPNKVFRKLNGFIYQHYIRNKIYKINDSYPSPN